jgi:hypothetical protein
MSNALTYDLMLETRGILRSSDVRVRLDRDLELGETIDSGAMVARHPGQLNKAGADVDRRAIARELPEVNQ